MRRDLAAAAARRCFTPSARFSSSPSYTGVPPEASPAAAAAALPPTPARRVLYKGPARRTLRLLVRFKLTQLAGVGAAAWAPLALGEALPGFVQAGLLSLAAGAAATTGALFFYSRRYVGELALLPGDALQLSTFDAWGNRAEHRFARADLLPPFALLQPAERREAARLAMLPLRVGERQYVLSPRFGTVLDGIELDRLLTGAPSAPPEGASNRVV